MLHDSTTFSLSVIDEVRLPMLKGDHPMRRHRFRSNALAAAFLLIFLVTVASGQSAAGNTILGKVRTQSGKPLASVLVELHTGTGALITQTFTGNEGDYGFTGLAGASFVLVVNDPNHQPFSERVELTRTAATRPGDVVRIDIMLTAKPETASPRTGVVLRQDVPQSALEAYRRGVKLIAERNSAEGVGALSEAIRVFPKYFDAHFALGLEMVRLRRYDDAIKELEQARALNPRDSRLYHTFGLVLFEQKKYALAASVFEATAKMDATNAEAHLMRAASLIEMGRLGEAETELKSADRISEHKLSIVHIHLARVYEKRGDRKRAADELETYLRKKPNAENATAIRDAIREFRSN